MERNNERFDFVTLTPPQKGDLDRCPFCIITSDAPSFSVYRMYFPFLFYYNLSFLRNQAQFLVF